MTRYAIGLDEEGVVNVRADLSQESRTTWDAGFVLHRKDGKLRWGLWDGRRILVDTDDRETAVRLIRALLEKGFYRAATALPEVIEVGVGYGTLLPPVHAQMVNLDADSVRVLREQLATLEGSA